MPRRSAVAARVGGAQPNASLRVDRDAVGVADLPAEDDFMAARPQSRLYVSNEGILFRHQFVGQPLVMDSRSIHGALDIQAEIDQVEQNLSKNISRWAAAGAISR